MDQCHLALNPFDKSLNGFIQSDKWAGILSWIFSVFFLLLLETNIFGIFFFELDIKQIRIFFSNIYLRSQVALLGIRFIFHDCLSIFLFHTESPESSYVPGSFSAKGRSKLRSPTAIGPGNLDKAINQVCFWKQQKKSSILNRLFSATPQIADWLNMDQNMAKNYHVDVGDIEAITEAINKQKVRNFIWKIEPYSSSLMWFHSIQSVVRDLDCKKPQLDELILLAEALKTDGNRQKLHAKSKWMFFRSILINKKKSIGKIFHSKNNLWTFFHARCKQIKNLIYQIIYQFWCKTKWKQVNKPINSGEYSESGRSFFREI